jgi:bifunctional DNA-binding transcriptional regulator/antitoxin component of YhaV-PrlF toxin-antitoxin module
MVVVDSKYRVVLEKSVRSAMGITRGERLVAIPFQGGVILSSSGGKQFAESLRKFNFKEEKHQAEHYLIRKTSEDADT